MKPEFFRYAAVGVAIAAVAIVSLATDQRERVASKADPSVPPAWEVLHPHDGRPAGNVPDLTY